MFINFSLSSVDILRGIVSTLVQLQSHLFLTPTCLRLSGTDLTRDIF